MEKRDTTIRPYKILIVDDDPLVVKTLERLLFKKRYLFVSVTSGEEALKMIHDKVIEPDMVLLDVFMEGMTGFEVCSQLKKSGFTSSVPVIFLTGSNQTSEIVKGFQAGAVDYILKPFNTEELLARLLTHLELKKAREEIRLMNMIKTRFFSIMTNDIKDSLTGVKGVAEFIHQELKNTPADINELNKLSTILLDDSTLLYQFVENLIKWDRIESGSKPIQIESVNIFILLQDVISRLAPSLEQKELAFHLKVDENIQISTDKRMLTDIIFELISNAIKYSYKGGQINIGTTKQEGFTTILIEDHGVGMDKDVAENVFRLDTPHPKTIGTFKEKGIGLGLILCHALVRKLDGKIVIESQRHKGVQISVQLPDLE